MPKQLFVFQVRLSPMGKHFVELYEGLVKVGVSRKTYSSAEEALSDMRDALENNQLANVLQFTPEDPPYAYHRGEPASRWEAQEMVNHGFIDATGKGGTTVPSEYKSY